MRRFQSVLLAGCLAVGCAAAASAEKLAPSPPLDLTYNAMDPTFNVTDLAYSKKPKAAPVFIQGPAPAPMNWTGVYGGFFGGGNIGNNRSFDITADPAAVNTVNVGPAANGGIPVFSQAYNNLANGGIGQVTNLINPTGANCVGLVNCNVGGVATTSITPNNNPGFRTDSMLPTSQDSLRLTALGGLEIGYRNQFDNNFVLGFGADITGFSRGGTSNVASTGSFFNSNGFTANSQAVGCTTTIGGAGPCTTAGLLNASGSVITVNSGGSTSNLAVAANPNWLGTVRASLGYAFDRLLIVGSAGLAYADGKMSVNGSYRDTVTSACSGVSNISSAAISGNAQVNYSCGGTPLNSASVSQVTTTAITYSGSHGGTLMGFAAGSGAAYAVTDHVALTIEGLYYNLGTVRTTATGTGTTTTTTTTTGIIPPGTNTTVTAAAAATATPITVSRVIDGFMLKAGIQFKF